MRRVVSLAGTLAPTAPIGVRILATLVWPLVIALMAGTVPCANAVPGPVPRDYVRTESGKVRCWVTATGQGTTNSSPTVICEASGLGPSQGGQNVGFLQAPLDGSGSHWHDAVVDAAGNFSFQNGNIGAAHPENDLVLHYDQTYHTQGWTIVPSSDGTRFTNDGTGHGMFVSIENVYGF